MYDGPGYYSQYGDPSIYSLPQTTGDPSIHYQSQPTDFKGSSFFFEQSALIPGHLLLSGESNPRTILLVVIAFLLLTGLAGVTAFLVLGSGVGEIPDDDTLDAKAGSGGGGGDDQGSKTTITQERKTSTARKTFPRTPRTMPPPTAPPPVAPPPVAPPPVVPPSVVPPPTPQRQQFSVTELVCTVGTFAVMPNMLPPDGLCPYLFYCDVVALDGALHGLKTVVSWEVFKQGIRNYTATEGGISFDARYVNPEHLAGIKMQNELATMSQQNIKHYGILNMVTEARNLVAYVSKAKLLIDKFKDLQGHDPNRKAMIAFGLLDYSGPDVWDLYSSQFKVTVERSQADTVIALSSTGSPPSQGKCVSVPPALFDTEKLPEASKGQSRPFPNLKRHATLVAADARYSRSNVKLGLSFEMGTLVYVMETKLHLHDMVYAKCRQGYVTNADVVACGVIGATDQLAAGVFVGHLPGERNVVYLWDEEDSFLNKLNDLNRTGNLRSGMSWLLHDTHLGDFEGDCMHSPFDRVKWIKDRFGIRSGKLSERRTM